MWFALIRPLAESKQTARSGISPCLKYRPGGTGNLFDRRVVLNRPAGRY
jgi:hypothetical protein